MDTWQSWMDGVRVYSKKASIGSFAFLCSLLATGGRMDLLFSLMLWLQGDL